MPLKDAPAQLPENPAGKADSAPRRSLARHLAEVQLLLDQAPSFLALTQGRSHVVVITNHACLTMVGRRREDLMGQPILEALPELKEQGLGQLFDGVLESGVQRTGAAMMIELRDLATGAVTQRRIDFILQPIFDATNQTVGIFIQGLDVTERELAIEALRQADRNKDNFLATLAHEMLNPLSASRVGLQMLSATLTAPSPDTARALAMLQRQYALLAALVEDLLDVSRIRLGKVALVYDDVPLQDVVNAAIETCQHHMEASSHELRVSMPPATLTVRADRRRLAQVLTNILVNSSKFTPPGGIIAIDVEHTPEAAEITISDNGKGMTADEARCAFDLYQQHVAGERSSKGLGIGLALVRQLVELQGGTVHAYSPGPSLGTSITLRFPVA